MPMGTVLLAACHGDGSFGISAMGTVLLAHRNDFGGAG